ncbi:MAG: hypothetical protein ABSC34_11765 [Acidimicrobiales bacterium]
MSLPSRHRRHDLTNLGFLIGFGAAFGYVEAAVVYYLRALMNFHRGYAIAHYKVLLNLGFITFITTRHSLLLNHRVSDAEVAREVATIVILCCVAYVAGRDTRQRLAAFLITFACWDIMYYVFLRVLDHWPSSLLTKDVFFLIPVTWIGPVLTPLIISTAMLALGVRLYLRPSTRF